MPPWVERAEGDSVGARRVTAHRPEQHPQIYSVTVKQPRPFVRQASRNCPALPCSSLWEHPLAAEWILWGLVEGDGTAPSALVIHQLFPHKLEDPRVSRNLPSLSFG